MLRISLIFRFLFKPDLSKKWNAVFRSTSTLPTIPWLRFFCISSRLLNSVDFEYLVIKGILLGFVSQVGLCDWVKLYLCTLTVFNQIPASCTLQMYISGKQRSCGSSTEEIWMIPLRKDRICQLNFEIFTFQGEGTGSYRSQGWGCWRKDIFSVLNVLNVSAERNLQYRQSNKHHRAVISCLRCHGVIIQKKARTPSYCAVSSFCAMYYVCKIARRVSSAQLHMWCCEYAKEQKKNITFFTYW